MDNAFLILCVGLVLAVVVAALAVVGIYNLLVGLRNAFHNAFAQIDVQFRRRHDLVPNLVEAAKGYLRHEHETLEDVIRARGQASDAVRCAAVGTPGALGELAAAETRLDGALARFGLAVEAYPELKADRQMLALHEELVSTENRIAFARQAYNDAVTSYNTARQRFPASLVAGAFGFGAADILAGDARAAAVPQVSF